MNYEVCYEPRAGMPALITAGRYARSDTMASHTITFPGLIDCHVHFREPGLTHKATMKSEAAAARAGGVLTVCDMPNTIPPTVTVAALEEKVRIADKIMGSDPASCDYAGVDIRFFMGATEKRHLLAIRDVWRHQSFALSRLKKRCAGLKVFFDHSTGNQGATAQTISEAFELCGHLDIPLVAHCEDPAVNAVASRKSQAANGDVGLHSRMRPPESETMAIEHAISLAKKFNTPFHIAHLSTAQGIDLVRSAKKRGLRVTCEVAPHHLFLTTEDYGTLGTLAKMNPPLRTREHQEALWEGLYDGTVDCIATDHAPHTLEEKRTGEPLKAPSGVPGVETMLPLLLTVASGGWPHPSSPRPNIQIFKYSSIQELCFENPNRIFQLCASADPRVEIDPDLSWTIRGSALHSQCGWTPFEGWHVQGKVVKVY